MSIRRCLITGASGQLGQAMVRLLGKTPDLDFKATDLPELDITSEEALDGYFDTHPRFDTVFNCAAYTAVDRAESEPDAAEALNNRAVRSLANRSDARGYRLIHVSTDYVFDGRACRPYREDDRVNPLGVYGATKLRGEEAVLQHTSNGVVVRTSWLYGPGGHNFVRTMLRLAGQNEVLRVISDQVGTPTSADDLAAALLAVAGQPDAEEPVLYHFSNEGVASWYDLARATIRLSGQSCPVEPVPTEAYPTPAARPAYSVLSKQKIRRDLGLNIAHWQDALEQCMPALTAPA